MQPAQRLTAAQRVLAQTFVQRSTRMLQRVSRAAPLGVLKTALESATDIGGVAALLSDLAPLGMDLSAVDPLSEAMARGVAAKQRLLKEAGGALTSARVAQGLGLTRQAVDKRRSRRALLAVPVGSGDYLYPACQFTEDGVIPGFAEVLQAFAVENPWTQLSALLAPAPALRGRSILTALKRGERPAAVAVAAAFGEQGG